MYLYPVNITDDIIETIAESQKIIPYLDMPLQHINDTILKRMQRRVNGAQTIELVEKLRAAIPNLVLRTTFITGFPGETEEQFEELKEFVRNTAFERMGAFTYSLEPGTPAVKLEDHLPEEVKEARRDELMAIQQDIAFKFGDSLIGYELDAIIDSQVEEGVYLGRIFADAPEIDGNIYVTGEGINIGDLIPVEIVDRQDYDLIGLYHGEDQQDGHEEVGSADANPGENWEPGQG
jgi:ribosomal protein S12 methylthiotransferase